MKSESERTQPMRNKWAILIATVMLSFMASLDTNMVNIALPVMADRLHVSTGMIAWVASIYLIAIKARGVGPNPVFSRRLRLMLRYPPCFTRVKLRRLPCLKHRRRASLFRLPCCTAA